MTTFDISIEVTGLSKSFGPVHALREMQLVGRAGQCHAVMGENGAGKSTLMKILSGVLRADSGTIVMNGSDLRLHHPRDARRAGISTIFQEFSLLPNLSIAENLFLGREQDDGKALTKWQMRERTANALAVLDLSVDPDRRVGSLGVGQQQMVEIAKGVIADARVFIFDEPTAALAQHEVDVLFRLIKRLVAENKTVFYVSHRLSEVFELCDDITIMKDGEFVRRVAATDTNVNEVIEGMVGRPIAELFEPRATDIGPTLLNANAYQSQAMQHPVDLEVHAGEIVGLAGLEAQGQQELMRGLAGFDPCLGGRLQLQGVDVTSQDAEQRLAKGIGIVPESRKDDGLFLSLAIGDNMESAQVARGSMFSFTPSLAETVRDVMQRLAVKAPDERTLVSELSGGNQQKVVLGRWLVAGAQVLLCEEPTRGVDIGAKREIYRQLRAFVQQGNCIVVTSRELTELIGLCDRLLVIRDGAIVSEMPADGATEDSLLRAALPL